MNHLRFVDVNGYNGWITDDLSLIYFGRDEIAASIDRYIDEIEATAGTDDDVLETLVLELPQACSVRMVERIDDGVAPT